MFLRKKKSAKADVYRSPYQAIYDLIDSDDPDDRARGAELIMRTGPVPGSFGDMDSYGPGRCRHLAPYPGCPKCWRR
jgi:hypothetical protein